MWKMFVMFVLRVLWKIDRQFIIYVEYEIS